jgi:hypothetical protein
MPVILHPHNWLIDMDVPGRSVPEANASFSLKPPTSPKQQIENHQQQNEAEAAAAIIAESGAHIVAAAAE